MLMILAEITLGIVCIDLAILFVWLGIIAYTQLVDTYKQVFQDHRTIGELINEYERNEEE